MLDPRGRLDGGNGADPLVEELVARGCGCPRYVGGGYTPTGC